MADAETCIKNLMDLVDKDETIKGYGKEEIEAMVNDYANAHGEGKVLYKKRIEELSKAKELSQEDALKNIEHEIRYLAIKKRKDNYIKEGQERTLAKAIISGSNTNIEGGKISFDNRLHHYTSILDNQWDELVGDKFGKMLKQKDFKNDVIRAVHELRVGRKSGKVFSKEVLEAADGIANFNKTMLREANARGLKLKNRADYIFTQNHDPTLMRRAGREEWVRTLMEDGVIDWDSSLENVPAGKAREEALGSLYYEILDSEFDTGGATTKLGSRELNFLGPEPLIAYTERFGNSDLSDVLDNARKGLAKKMSIYESLGPKPVEMFDKILDEIEKDLIELGDEARLTKFRASKVADNNKLKKELFGYGRTGAVEGTIEGNIVKVITTAKDMSYLSKLIGSVFSTPTDLGLSASNTAIKTGENIGKIFSKTIGRYIKTLPPGTAKKVARHFDLHIQSNIQARMDIEGAASRAGKVANFWSRLNMMEQNTNVNRATAVRIFSDVLVDGSKTKYVDLDPQITKELKAFDIGAKEWDFLGEHAVGYVDELGGEIMSTSILRKKDFGKLGIDKKFALDTSDKLGMLLNFEGFERGAPQTNTAGRASMRMGVNPKSVAGAAISALLQFKSYGLHIAKVIQELTTHIDGDFFTKDMLKNKGNLWAFGHLTATTFMMSSLGMMARDVAFGRPVRDPTDPKNMLEAYLRGAMPVYLDPIFSTVTGDYSKGNFNSVLKFAGGPVLGSLSDLMQVASMAFDPDTKWSTVGKRSMNWIKYNMPRGNPMIAAVLDKALFEALEEKMGNGNKRKEQRYKTLFGE